MKKLVKPKQYMEKYYEWNEMVDFIEGKYKCDIRDYANSISSLNDEIPYQDFWHELIEYNSEIGNNQIADIDFTDMKKQYKDEKWVRKICDMFIKEFGNKVLHIQTNW